MGVGGYFGCDALALDSMTNLSIILPGTPIAIDNKKKFVTATICNHTAK